MKHPGFKAVQAKVQSEGYSKKAAGAIVASAARNASPAAKKANPRLNKVKSHEKPNESKAHEAKESPAVERREKMTGEEQSGAKSFHHRITGSPYGKCKTC